MVTRLVAEPRLPGGRLRGDDRRGLRERRPGRGPTPSRRRSPANGFDLNFAPVVDLDVNPDSPAIGALDRSFSADPDVVVARATIEIDAHRAAGVRTTLKHFPGIGSSTTNTDFGVADVTKTWTRARARAVPPADRCRQGRSRHGRPCRQRPARPRTIRHRCRRPSSPISCVASSAGTGSSSPTICRRRRSPRRSGATRRSSWPWRRATTCSCSPTSSSTTRSSSRGSSRSSARRSHPAGSPSRGSTRRTAACQALFGSTA